MQQLAGIANKEAQKKAMVNLQTRGKPSDNGNKATNSNNGNTTNISDRKKQRETITCTDCK